MKYTFTLLLLCCFQLAASGQEFTTVSYHSDLDMDIYVPQGEISGIILFVHGGGFGGGNRRSGEVFCKNSADANFAAITMSYRLLMAGRGFGCDIPAEEKKNVFLEAGRDISRATAWILENSEDYGLTSDKIILAGSSAGAEAILHAAYWEDTKMTDEGERLLPEDFEYAGVISMAGALFDISLITEENALPTLLFHGTCDPLVPYGTAPHHYCDPEEPGYIILHGSQSIAKRMAELNKPYSIVSECGGGHEWAGEPMDNYFSYVANFLTSPETFEEVLPGEVDCDYEVVGVCE
jgi:para-nitrobenzyl esterase